VDIVGLITSTPLVDIFVLAGLSLAFIVGIVQGTIRGLIGLLVLLLSFVVAANVSHPLGDFLAGNWKQFPHDYNRMLAFGIVFFVLSLGTIVAIQLFYRRLEIYAQRPIVDDALGGLIGVAEGFLMLLFLVIILASYPMPPPFPGDVEPLRQVQDALVNQSHIGAALKSNVAPSVLQLLSALLPSDLVSMFP
jgi:uncharacterized membrane protein required for colicin V production